MLISTAYYRSAVSGAASTKGNSVTNLVQKGLIKNVSAISKPRAAQHVRATVSARACRTCRIRRHVGARAAGACRLCSARVMCGVRHADRGLSQLNALRQGREGSSVSKKAFKTIRHVALTGSRVKNSESGVLAELQMGSDFLRSGGSKSQ